MRMAVLAMVGVLCAWCVAIAMTPVQHAWAATDSANNVTYEVKGGEAVVTGMADESKTAVVIPAQLGGYDVTAIEQRAFENCTNLKTVTINADIAEIPIYAFEKCKSLKSVTFGMYANVGIINTGAFYECMALEEFTAPASLYGPKYRPPSFRIWRVLITRGKGSLVILI